MTLKAAITQIGITQTELSKISGVNLRQISSLATGASKLENTTGKNLLAISSALGITIEELLLNDDCQIDNIANDAKKLPPIDRSSFIKYERAKDYSGWRCYPATCSKLIAQIPTDWWSIYSAKHIGDVMRLLHQSYINGSNNT